MIPRACVCTLVHEGINKAKDLHLHVCIYTCVYVYMLAYTCVYMSAGVSVCSHHPQNAVILHDWPASRISLLS